MRRIGCRVQYGGAPSYMLMGETDKIREALSVALDEFEIDEILE
jgi:hypothetical protein